jgi:hypothetical protein
MNEMLRPVMVLSYVLGLLLVGVAACLKLVALAGVGPGFQAGNWGIGACAMFLCVLASARMMEAGRK